MQADLEYLEGWDLHRRVVIDGVLRARHSVWIATANLKDLHVKAQGTYRSILNEFGVLCAGGVEVRILHGGVPSECFLHSYKESGLVGDKLFRARRCPRVHFKAVLMDGQTLYLGSANFTGAGLGVKTEERRNFENGILTSSPELIKSVTSLFRVIWEGKMCEGCGRRESCFCPLEELS